MRNLQQLSQWVILILPSEVLLKCPVIRNTLDQRSIKPFNKPPQVVQAIIEGETLQVLGCKSLWEDGLLVTVSRWALLWSWTLGTSYKSANKSWESPNYPPLTTCVAHNVTCLFTDYWGATTTTSSYKHKSYFKNRILCNINLKLWPDELDWVKLNLFYQDGVIKANPC